MIFKQPKSTYIILIIELLERFSFYSLQSILIIYLVKKISLSEKDAINIFSSFNAIIYGLVIIGGWLGDKIIGYKRTLLTGIILLIIGYINIYISEKNINILYLGISIISLGSCLFKPTLSSLLADIYKKKSITPDTGFTMYYMSINIGSLLSIVITPWLVNNYGWKTALTLPIIGLIIVLWIYIKSNKILKKYGSKIDFEELSKKNIYITILLLITILIGIFYLINKQKIINNIIKIIFLSIILIFIKEIWLISIKKKKKIIVAFILMIEAIIFFILYNQIPTSLNFFAIRNVKHKILGINFSPEQFQALNPFWIIIFSPILSYIYNKLGKKLSVINKFSIGMILCSISFIILPIGIYLDTNIKGLISPYWLVLSYAFQGIGELMISGLGLSMITQLIPKKLLGLTISTWFLTTSISIIISSNIANLMTFPKNTNINTFESLKIYSNNFFKIGTYSIIASIIILLLTPILNSIIKK